MTSDTFLKCLKTSWLEETLLRILGSVFAFSSESAEEGSPNWERCCTMLSTLNFVSQNCFTTNIVTFPWILTDDWIFQPLIEPLALLVHFRVKISILNSVRTFLFYAKHVKMRNTIKLMNWIICVYFSYLWWLVSISDSRKMIILAKDFSYIGF